jgi:hypothetical protein
MVRNFVLAGATAALVLSAAASSQAAVEINGGSSWGGWDPRGNSLNVGIWGAASVTRSYDLYTTVFTFNNDTFNSGTGGVQVRPAFSAAGQPPSGFGSGDFSKGAFANGNRVLGIGLDLNGDASTLGSTFVTFGLKGDDFQAASALGAGDGRVSGSTWGHAGDFAVWMDGAGNGPSNLAVYKSDGTAQGGTGAYSNLVGGFGSGVSYDFAFRMFRNGTTGGSIQMFFDLTAMQDLYGGGPNQILSGWVDGNTYLPAPAQLIGPIGNNFNIAMYNDGGSVGANLVTFGVSSGAAVPEPATWAMMIGGFGLAGAMLRRRRVVAA